MKKIVNVEEVLEEVAESQEIAVEPSEESQETPEAADFPTDAESKCHEAAEHEVSEDIADEVHESDDSAAVVESDVKIVYVENARIFRTASVEAASRLYSGNVEVLGAEGGFTKVRYVKHGFGPINGFVLGSIK